MRKLVLLLLTLPLIQVFAQAPEPCGTVITDEWMQAFYNRDKSHLESHSRGGFPEVKIPIIYHLVGTDNGSGYYSMTDLLRLHCDFQAAMDPANIQFYIYDIDYINSTSFYNGNNTSQLFNFYNNTSVLNVYIVDDMAGVCGYSYVPAAPSTGSGWSGPNRGGVMLQKGCLDVGSTTYIHEGGHYLNLPHTFYGWEGEDAPNSNSPAPNSISGIPVERVNGSNCLSAGDGFCDTPPDYISDRWQCFTIPTFQDPNGQVFSVDEKNYMSYSSDVCAEYFTNDQLAEMNAAPANFRSYLLDITPPVIEPLDLVTETFPNNLNNLSPSNNLTLKWNDIDGADYYLLQVTLGNFFNPIVEEVVTDTFFNLTNLLTDADYEWRVKPYNYNYVCTDYSDIAKFSTASFMINVATTEVNCAEDASGAATVSFATPGNYDVFWNANDPIIDNQISSFSGTSINNLVAGTYDVVVVNSNTGDSAVLPFNVIEPQEIVLDIQQVGNTLQANVVGGTPPYTIIWGSGENGSVLNNPVAGENTILLVDANGCQKSASYTYNPGAVGIADQNDVQFVMYPNPANNQFVNLSLVAAKGNTLQVGIYNTAGQLQTQNTFEIDNVKNVYSVSLDNLNNGVYFVKVALDGAVRTERLVVMR